MIFLLYFDLAFHRRGVRHFTKPSVVAANALAEAIDERFEHHHKPAPGTLHANHHVVAEVAR